MGMGCEVSTRDLTHWGHYKMAAIFQTTFSNAFWPPPGDRPFSETMMVKLLTHICVTRPQWVKEGEGFDIWMPCGRHFVKCNNKLTSPGFHCITLYTTFQKLSTQCSIPFVFTHLRGLWCLQLNNCYSCQSIFISSYNDHCCIVE